MYQIENSRQVLQGGRRFGLASWRRPGRNVVLLGFTSMFTDISAEMVNTILPLYLVFTLGLAPIQYGLIDGINQGGSALVRVFSGFLADRTGRPKTWPSLATRSRRSRKLGCSWHKVLLH